MGRKFGSKKILTFNIRLPEDEHEDLKAYAAKKGDSGSELFREALIEKMERDGFRRKAKKKL